MTNSNAPTPNRSEVWLVDFNPTKGAEIRKMRPAVVINSDAVGVLPIRLVAPMTGWNPSYASKSWIVEIPSTNRNGLDKDSATDALQLRGVSTERFVKRLGRLSAPKMEEIATTVAAVVEYI
jgi:mRNA interferase MazF